jgi:molybdopterin converting factor small subunit
MSEKIVKILLFASIKEKIGKSSLDIKIEQEMNLTEFFNILKNLNSEFYSIANMIEKNAIIPYMLVLNGSQINLKDENIIFPGSELAILPPVGGG